MTNLRDNNYEEIFSPKYAIEKFKVTGSTLRKWCLSLEAKGYTFGRDDNDKRFFYERDLKLLKDLQQLLDAGRTLEQASERVISRLPKDSLTTTVPAINPQKVVPAPFPEGYMLPPELMQEFRTAIRQEIKAELETQLTDRDKILMETLRTMQEMKQIQLQMAAAREEEQKTKKKSKWAFWNR